MAAIDKVKIIVVGDSGKHEKNNLILSTYFFLSIIDIL